MHSVTAGGALSFLDACVDWERSRAFHAGGVRLDLHRAGALLASLAERPWPPVCVHVAGSEGKTSTSSLVAAGLSALGLPAGCYTSPHLRDVRERLRIDGAFPAEHELAAAAAAVAPVAERLGATWFECLTALARALFVPPRVRAAVWETGLGGRLDATRALRADVCAITSISLEHTAILGDTLEQIAAEKAGILRPGAPVVLGDWLPGAARAVIEARAAELGAPVCVVRADGAGGRAGDGDAPARTEPLWARRNRAVATGVLDALAARALVPPRTPAVDAALRAHAVAGRMQRVGRVLFDGAHTVAAARLLAAELCGQRVGAIVFATSSGRDAGAMLAALVPCAARVVLTRTPGPRGASRAELVALEPHARAGGARRVEIVDEPRAALAAALDGLADGEVVLVTGSLYLVGALLAEPCGGTDPAPAVAAAHPAAGRA